LAKYSSEENKRFKSFSEQSSAALLKRRWPGNVRELINVVRATVALHDGELVEVGMLAPEQIQVSPVSATTAALESSVSGDAPATSFMTSFEDKERIKPLAQIEREAIESALRAYSGNVTRAAKALQVNPSTIHRKMSAWS